MKYLIYKLREKFIRRSREKKEVALWIKKKNHTNKVRIYVRLLPKAKRYNIQNS